MKQPDIVRVFVSSTWLDLRPEREAVEKLLQRFREIKFVGMEYYGSRDDTTLMASLAEVDRSDLYLGIIGGRYGSGITEAEYRRARELKRPCLLYFKQDDAVPPDGRDADPEKREQLARFKSRLRGPRSGHLVPEFASPSELTLQIATDLHHWLFEHLFSPALSQAAEASQQAEMTRAIGGDLQSLAKLNQELLTQLAEEKRRRDEHLRIALGAFANLTYEVREALVGRPELIAFRKKMVENSIALLEKLFELSGGRHDVLRELATNHRAHAEILMTERDYDGALADFAKSAGYCMSLVAMQPDDALYHRDLAVSHFNCGAILHGLGRYPEAQKEYLAALPGARRAAALEPEQAIYSNLKRDVEGAIRRDEPPAARQAKG